MAGLVLDTHATIWYLEGSPKLSAEALAAIQTVRTHAFAREKPGGRR
jgi:PIN domain nuclease of toxin-antitoxin system